MFLIIMVGLPARGKSSISKKISNYFNWIGYNTQIFNAGDLRRQKPQNSNFFSQECKNYRDDISYEQFDNLLNWIKLNKNSIGIFDATNTTLQRRNKLMNMVDTFTPLQNLKVIFVESCIENTDLIYQNMLTNKQYRNLLNFLHI